MSRAYPHLALWLLLGFVLGGVLAPAWHTAHHGPATLAHTDGTHAGGHAAGHASHVTGEAAGASLTDSETAAHPFACALCAVPLSWTAPPALTALPAPALAEVLAALPPQVTVRPAGTAYAPRGPPTSC